jgi:hypothetical protein
MLTVTPQLDLVACLTAVIAAVLPVKPIRWHHALAGRMRAFRGIGHYAPLNFHSTPVHSVPQRVLLSAVVLASVAMAEPLAQTDDELDLAQTLDRVGSRVEQFYRRAQSLVSDETVWIQSLRGDMTPSNLPRRLLYELRLAWEADSPETVGSLPEASVLRQVLAINGRPPRPDDEPGCMDPKPVSPEPLEMLLPPKREKFVFSAAGSTRIGGRAARTIDYRSIDTAPPSITWRDNCVSISLPGQSRGRVWIDAVTHDVLRLDEHMVGQFEFDVPREQQRRGATSRMLIERVDTSIHFRRVSFRDPEETLMLPEAIETFQIVRGGGIQRTRITQRFSNYRRFLTGGRIVQ